MPESDKPCANNSLNQLLRIMAQLRNPQGGCPWDLQQTFASIAPYTVEEAYEVADAIEREDKTELCHELGDLLFQVVFHARMAEEEGSFNFDDVARAICDKLTRRHPHVFDGQEIAPEDLSRQWESFKQQERSGKSAHAYVLDDIPAGMPALTRAIKLQKRAAREGFDWPKIAPVFDKIQEEIAELKEEIQIDSNTQRIEMELGDLLFSCVNLARHLNVNPEWSLRGANQRFQDRFNAIESNLRAQGRQISDAELDELDRMWEISKQELAQKA